MAFGTPGADQQDQWSLQFFLNCVDFGMNLQAAVDAPVFYTNHFPSSFFPHGADYLDPAHPRYNPALAQAVLDWLAADAGK